MFSGSSGEEVMLSERRLQEEDIENPPASSPPNPHDSWLSPTAAGLYHSDDDGSEPEQDFISSVVSQKEGRRVHWGELPKHTSEDKGEVNLEDRDFPENQSIEEAITKLDLCSLSEKVTPNTSSSGSSAAQAQTSKEHSLNTSCEDLKPSTQIRPQLDPLKCSANQNNHNIQNQPDLNITQIGMSKRGAAGLRDLLKNQSLTVRPDSIRLKLVECLKRTLKEWSTDETLTFLYGPGHSLGSPFADVKGETQETEEELDEDDLEEEVEDNGVVSHVRPLEAAPDYEALQMQTQQMELRIREFYKGTWPEDLEKPEQGGNKVKEREPEKGNLL